MDSPKIFSVNCNHCGATLEVDEKTRFLTCAYCHSRLAVQHTASTVFTEVLEKIEAQTGQIAGNLKVIEMQNDLDQLDREWSMSRENLMVSGKNGARSEPSMAGGLVTIIIAIVAGGAWTLFAASMHAPGIVPLFGLFFIGFGLFAGITSMSKAGQLNTTRSDYESRRRQLLNAIEEEKRRQ